MFERNGRGHRSVTSKGDYWDCRLASLRIFKYYLLDQIAEVSGLKIRLNVCT